MSCEFDQCPYFKAHETGQGSKIGKILIAQNWNWVGCGVNILRLHRFQGIGMEC